MEDWTYSSFIDFVNLRKGTLVNKSLATELLDLDEGKLYQESYVVIPPKIEEKLFK